MVDSPVAHGPTLPDRGRGGRAIKAADRLAIGARAGDYEVTGFLGAGGMGEVYAGKHPVIGKRVAIKVLKRELAADADAAERFTREARAVNQVAHANVIDVFAFGRLADERLYLVMDLVDGKSLRELVSEGPVPVAEALQILAQIASALDAAHTRGVVHRDLKPDNVMLGDANHVFVLDFGLAKLVALGTAAPIQTLTEAGTWLGTPGYMAPEQWSADGAGPASDRYALAVMAFELLCGAVPFAAPTLPQMMEQHFRAPVPALSARGTAPSGDFDAVLAKGMAKDPDARFATATALVDALRTAADLPTPRSRAGKGRAARWWTPAAAGAGVLGLAVVAVLVTRDRGSDSAAAAATARATVNADRATIQVSSVPVGAAVLRDGRLLGSTPVTLEVSGAEQARLVMKKPGFRPEVIVVGAADSHRVVQLVPQNGFEGIWVLPDGQLRSFKRVDDGNVDVYKLTALTATPAFYRRYALEASDAADTDSTVMYAATETASEGTDPSCQIGFRVEYRFSPDRDALLVRQEHLDLTKRDGACLVHARWMGEAATLKRADTIGEDEHRTLVAPMGTPSLTKPSNAAPTSSGSTPQRKPKRPRPTTAQAVRPPAKPSSLPLDNSPFQDANTVNAPAQAVQNSYDGVPSQQAPNQAPQQQQAEPVQQPPVRGE